MKINSFLIPVIALALIVSSCGKPTLKTKEEAIKFLESNKFYDDDANINGRNGGSLKSPFGLIFSNGNVTIGEETLPYTIEEKLDPYFGSIVTGVPEKGFIIQICGSQRYAYGGCIKGYLSTGFLPSGAKEKTGCSLTIKGDYVNAFFSYVTDNGITKK